jgi:hypothetical protein
MPDTATTTDQIAALARDYRKLDTARAAIEARQADIKTRVRDLMSVGQKVDVDGKAVTLTAQRKLNVDLAASYLPTELRAQCLVETYDVKALRQYLAPTVIEACMVESGAPRVTLA